MWCSVCDLFDVCVFGVMCGGLYVMCLMCVCVLKCSVCDMFDVYVCGYWRSGFDVFDVRVCVCVDCGIVCVMCLMCVCYMVYFV